MFSNGYENQVQTLAKQGYTFIYGQLPSLEENEKTGKLKIYTQYDVITKINKTRKSRKIYLRNPGEQGNTGRVL
jgi:hypothetical protein